MLPRNVSDHLQKNIFLFKCSPRTDGYVQSALGTCLQVGEKIMTHLPTKSNMIGCFSHAQDGSAGWFSKQEVHGIRMVNTICVRDSADVEPLGRCS